MPVSSPSYFPPNRANGTIVGITAGETTTGSRNFLAGKNAGNYLTQSDVIAIGDSVISAGTSVNPLLDTNIPFSVIIGSKTAQNVVGFSNSYPGPSVIIGGNSWTSAVRAPSMVCIGCNIFPNNVTPNATGGTVGGSVMVGNNIGGTSAASTYSSQADVLIGEGVLSSLNDSFYGGSDRNVIIGYNAASNTSTSNEVGFTFNTIIGAVAGQSANGRNDILIGYSAANQFQGTNTNEPGCTVVGSQTDLGNGNSQSHVAIGCFTASKGGGKYNVIVGTGALCNSLIGGCTMLGDYSLSYGSNTNFTGNRTILIGLNAGNASSNTSDLFAIETNDYVTTRTMFWGDLSKGNLIIGNSTNGTNRDMSGTNTVKLITGTAPGASVGGGAFYVTGANNDIHWVGSDGTDTNLVAGSSGALTYTYNVPLTGFAITVADNIAQLVLEPAGTLASGTVTLPAAPEDGDTVGISTTQTITALTISPNTGQTIADAPTTLGVGGAVRFLYRAANTTWYRIAN